MKFLKYIGTLFIPSQLGQRRNISVFISLLILLLSSYLIAIPYMVVFEKHAYETYCDAESYNFRILDDEFSKEIDFTEEEKVKLGDKYIYSTFNELKEIEFVIENGEYKIPEDINNLSEVPFNGKEYLLKREVYYFDKDGTKLDETSIYYIHIVFDIYDAVKDAKYAMKEEFDKKLDFTNENHYLLLFNIDGFAFRNEYMIDNNIKSFGFAYDDVAINFNEMTSIDYIPNKLAKILIPETKMQYSYNGFMYTVISPTVLALLAFLIIKRKSVLVTYKNYFNVAALASIPVTILVFALEWNELMIRIGIMELYWVLLAIYYFVVLHLIDRKSKVE